MIHTKSESDLAPAASNQGSLADVVNGGYCVGCGACAAVKGTPVTMKFHPHARYEPDLTAWRGEAEFGAPCPFLRGPDEDELAAQQYERYGGKHDAHLGWFQSLYAGYAVEGQHRAVGSSGGLTNWLLSELLRRGMITAVIHVRPVDDGDEQPRFSYSISTSQESLSANAKTRYYPIEISQVMELVRNTPGRYAFVGVPCYVKALRRLALHDDLIRERIVYVLSLFCGHMKTGRFAESLAWQMTGRPDGWQTVDFRRKIPGRPASAYGFAVQPRDGAPELVTPMGKLEGYDWGMGVFRLSACDYCDDVVGETADASFGDAWLPAYVNDSNGTSLVIVRHPELQRIFEESHVEDKVFLEQCSVADMVKSQDASFRHRREGLSYRLWLMDRRKRWRPIKRVRADGGHLMLVYKIIFRYRVLMSWVSHRAFALARTAKSLQVYTLAVRVMSRLNKYLVKKSRSQSLAQRS